MAKPKSSEQPEAGKDIERAVSEIETAVELAMPELKTARGDIRDVLLDLFKHRPKVWSAMSQGEQQQVATALDQAAESLVRKVARALATAGHKAVPGTLESMNIKDGLKLTIKAPMLMDNVDALADGIGKQVMVLRSMEGLSMGQRAPAKIDPDQPSLIPEGDNDLAGEAEAVVDGLKRPVDPEPSLLDPAQAADDKAQRQEPDFD